MSKKLTIEEVKRRLFEMYGDVVTLDESTYVDTHTNKIIESSRKKQAERQRQGIKTKQIKSLVKQILDIEAKSTLARCKRTSLNLAIESPKVLNNLRNGQLQGWARNYFANRCYTLAKEQEVFVFEVNPSYTSITCSKCGHVDKQSRCKQTFCCTSCGHSDHADVNAARNIATKGTANLKKWIFKCSGGRKV